MRTKGPQGCMKSGLCEIQLPLGAAWAVPSRAAVKALPPRTFGATLPEAAIGTRKHHQPKAQKTEGTPGAKTVAPRDKEATVYVG